MEASSAPGQGQGKLKKKTQLKKWFVAKICEHSRGRQLIHRMTGNVGVDVIDAAQGVVAKHSGDTVAADVSLQLYKIICKAGVLITEKEMTDEMMRPCKQPNLVLMHCLIEQLQEPIETRDASVLTELLEDCYHPLIALLTRFEGSAPHRLGKLKTFVLESNVLSFFLESEEAKAEREIILKSLHNVLVPYQAEVVQITQVVRQGLLNRKRELDRLLVKPTLTDYLRNTSTYTVLCDWFAKNRDPESIHWLYFYKSAKEYSTVTSRHLMSMRAMQIQKKYLRGPGCHCPVTLPADLLERVAQRIDLEEVTQGLFSEALAYTVSILKDDFTEMFKEVQHFDFLREELATVESKLSALTRQATDTSGVITSTHSLFDGEFHVDTERMTSGVKVETPSSHKYSSQSSDNTVSRMSFWN